MQLSVNGEVTGLALHDVGVKFAALSACLPEQKLGLPDAIQLSADQNELAQQAISMYDRALSEVAV